ncbi:hypothetical protein [Dyella mobilis]|uniref:DUF4145 domain-containing protein n=1 Tax=Dyella mobilis TaxID=1849582 RepID=A0ABS2KEG4_9GAMM|nr:hypothetical protein [Dyella mobilis]MBM7128738.1 hypothetical protein [Dyella mobilis]GLQ99065.1 hypothetical protein GCM10007863_34850 [Dyella mobilis]
MSDECDGDHELAVAQKYHLYWAQATMEDEQGRALVNGSYLYRPSRFWEPFWILFDKLGQLNDYCFNQLIASEGTLMKLQHQSVKVIGEASVGAEALDYYSEAIPGWEDNVATFAKAAPLILLASLTEWGLKHLAYSLFGHVPKKTDRSMSDIQFHLNYLVHSGLKLNEPESLLTPIGTFREVRNNFAHGNWGTLTGQLQSVCLRDAIEEAAWRCDALTDK